MKAAGTFKNIPDNLRLHALILIFCCYLERENYKVLKLRVNNNASLQ